MSSADQYQKPLRVLIAEPRITASQDENQTHNEPRKFPWRRKAIRSEQPKRHFEALINECDVTIKTLKDKIAAWEQDFDGVFRPFLGRTEELTKENNSLRDQIHIQQKLISDLEERWRSHKHKVVILDGDGLYDGSDSDADEASDIEELSGGKESGGGDGGVGEDGHGKVSDEKKETVPRSSGSEASTKKPVSTKLSLSTGNT